MPVGEVQRTGWRGRGPEGVSLVLNRRLNGSRRRLSEHIVNLVGQDGFSPLKERGIGAITAAPVPCKAIPFYGGNLGGTAGNPRP